MTAFSDILLSRGPIPGAPPELMQFGRFVGAWDLDVFYYAQDGSVTRQLCGEWHFGWVLEGRAVADVWIVPSRAMRDPSDPSPGEYGMSLRFYDSSAACWHSTWLGPVNKVVFPFTARQVEDRMVLERSDGQKLVRWSFSNITHDTFTWENTVSIDDGGSWLLEQSFLARRSTQSLVKAGLSQPC